MTSQGLSKVTNGTDDLGIFYASKAAKGNAKAKEAAMMFVIAEEHINDGESYEDALKCANKALKIYRDIENSTAVADTLRLIIHAHRMKSDILRQNYPGDPSKIKEADSTLRKADELAHVSAEAFRRQGDVRGQAAMLLASAEVNFQGLGDAQRKKAQAALAEAIELSREAGDKRLEAAAVHLVGYINLSLHKVEIGVKHALDARLHYKAIHDTMGEAKVLHTISEGRIAQGLVNEAIMASREAISLWSSMGKQRQEAFELHTLGTVFLDAGEADQALECGQKCQQIFKDLNYGKGWVAASMGLVIQSHIAKGDAPAALEAAGEAVFDFRESAEKKDLILALKSLSAAQEASNDLSTALKTAEEELAICKELGDERWEAHSIQHVASLQSALNNHKDAAEMAKKAFGMFRKVDDKYGEANAIFMAAQELMQAGDAGAALKATREAQTIFWKNGQKELEGALLLLVAEVQLMLGDEEEAMAAAKEAEAALHGVRDLRNEAAAVRIIADIHRVNDQYEEAAKEGVKAQARLRDLGDKDNEVATVRWLSDLHTQFKKTKPALRTAKDLLRATKGGDARSHAEAYMMVAEKTVAHLKAEAEQHAETSKLIAAKAPAAIKPHKEAVSLAKKIEDNKLICKALIGFGRACVDLGIPQDAVEIAEEAMALSETLEEKPIEAATLVLMAEARGATARMDLATDLATKAFKLAVEINDTDIQERCKKFVVAGVGMPMRGGKRMGTRIEKRKVKKWVKKGGGGGGAGGGALAISKDQADSMVLAVLKQAATELEGDAHLDVPLMDMGLDSLSAINVRNDLNKATSLNLPGTLMFDFPTAGAISGFITEQSIEQGGGGGGAVAGGEDEWEEVEVEEDVEVPYEIDDGFGGGGGVRYEMRKVKKWVKKDKKKGGGGGGGKVAITAELANAQVMTILKAVATDVEGDIVADVPLMDLGVDSLSAINFRNDLNKSTGLNLPGTVMFDFPTASAIAGFIVEQSAEQVGAGGGGGGDAIDDGEDEWEEVEVEEQVAVPIEGGGYFPPMEVAIPGAASAAPAAPAEAAVAKKKQGLTKEQVSPMVLENLKSMASEAGVDASLDIPLMDAGMDSLAAINFRNDLMKATGLKLPGTLMFDMPTAGMIVDFIIEESERSAE